jgi:ATP-dependent Lon protease
MKKSLLDSLIFSGISEGDPAELIQLVSTDETDEADQQFPDDISILPVRNTVLFPGVVLPITVGRQKSIKLVKKAYNGEKIIGVIAQKNMKIEDPEVKDLYAVGTVARILKMLVLPDGNTTIIIQGQKRFKIDQVIAEKPYLQASVSYLKEDALNPKKKDHNALIASLKDAATKILKLNPEIPKEAEIALNNIENSHFLTHFLSSNINAEVAEKQKLLEINNSIQRATLLLEFLFFSHFCINIRR